MDSYSLAERINSDVNASVTYKTDLNQYDRPEYWCEAGKYGDCEDYALLKRAYHLEQGWPIDKLYLAECIINSVKQHHCVLIVETDKGCFCLDCNYEWPKNPKELDYTWIKCLKVDKWYELSF